MTAVFLLYFALRLVHKTRAILSTNQRQTKTIHDLDARVFPRFGQFGCFYHEFLLALERIFLSSVCRRDYFSDDIPQKSAPIMESYTDKYKFHFLSIFCLLNFTESKFENLLQNAPRIRLFRPVIFFVCCCYGHFLKYQLLLTFLSFRILMANTGSGNVKNLCPLKKSEKKKTKIFSGK